MNLGDDNRPADHSEAVDHAARADEMLAHGLLLVVHEADGAPRNARVARVMAALTPPATEVAVRPHEPPRVSGRRRRQWSRALGAGTLFMALAVIFVMMATPTSNKTFAAIEDSISAMRGSGERRYEVRAEVGRIGPFFEKDGAGGNDSELIPGPHAVIDTRAPGLMLLQLHGPDGTTMTVGRDERGEWAIAPDGEIDRDHPRRAWPGWAMQEGDSLSADSLDRWLEAFAQSYDLERLDDAAAPGGSSTICEHIVGTRPPAPPAVIQRLRGADRIEVWINKETKAVERMELFWRPPPRPGMRPAIGPGGPDPERAESSVERTRPQGPGGDDATSNDRPGRPDRPEGPPFGRPFPGPLGREGPPGPPNGPPDGTADRPFDGPRDGPHDRPSGGPPGERMPHGPGGIERPDGPGGMGGPAGPRGRPPPLRRLVIQRVDAPALAADWFTPEAHVKK